MKTIALIIMVAIVLEALIEYIKTIMHMVENGDHKTAITQGITILLGVGLAFAFHLELFNMGMSEIYEGLKINSTLDMILTGVLFSRGSNYFSDLISKLQHKTGSDQLLAMYEDGLDYVDDVVDEEYDEVGEEDADSEEA